MKLSSNDDEGSEYVFLFKLHLHYQTYTIHNKHSDVLTLKYDVGKTRYSNFRMQFLFATIVNKTEYKFFVTCYINSFELTEGHDRCKGQRD